MDGTAEAARWCSDRIGVIERNDASAYRCQGQSKEEEQKVREDRLQQLKDCRQYILVNNYGYYIYLPW